MGDRGDHRSADPLRQDGGHGRPGPLRRARPSQGQVQGVGARLRPHQLAEGRRRAGQAARSQGGGGAERGGGGAVLSGDLLVLDAEDPGRQRVRQEGQRYSRQDHPGRVAQRDQEPGLRRLSPARPALHPHDPGGVRRVQVGRGRLAPPHHVGPGRPADDQSARRVSRRRAVSSISATGPIASPRASCRTPSRRGRKGSSATWSSPPGTGATRSSISTT